MYVVKTGENEELAKENPEENRDFSVGSGISDMVASSGAKWGCAGHVTAPPGLRLLEGGATLCGLVPAADRCAGLQLPPGCGLGDWSPLCWPRLSQGKPPRNPPPCPVS